MKATPLSDLRQAQTRTDACGRRRVMRRGANDSRYRLRALLDAHRGRDRGA